MIYTIDIPLESIAPWAATTIALLITLKVYWEPFLKFLSSIFNNRSYKKRYEELLLQLDEEIAKRKKGEIECRERVQKLEEEWKMERERIVQDTVDYRTKYAMVLGALTIIKGKLHDMGVGDLNALNQLLKDEGKGNT